MNLLIKNVRIIDPANGLDAVSSMAIREGLIDKIDSNLEEGHFDQIIDAKDCWLMPGVVDLCNRPHLKHPHGTTLLHEANAAAMRGITAICIPPDVNPILDNTSSLHHIQSDATKVNAALYPIAAMTTGLEGKELADSEALIKAGGIAISQGQGHNLSTHFLKTCYEYAASFDIPVVIQPHDSQLRKNGCMHEGVVSSRLGLPGIPYTSETIAVYKHLAFIEQSGIRAHFTCLSSYRSLELIENAKQKGLPVTADVAMHSLVLTEMDVMYFDANCHLYPPLRSQSDQLGLIQGVRDGVIDAICSDHNPLDSIAKLAPFPDSEPGLSAIDTFLSLGVYLVQNQQLDINTLVKAISQKPADIFNLPHGRLQIGDMANCVVINPNLYWEVKPEHIKSAGKNTPFKGWELPGVITHTLSKGQLTVF